jgi:hypothetical protein
MAETYTADSIDSTTSTGDATHEQDVTYYADDQHPDVKKSAARESKVVAPAASKSSSAETK